MSPCNICEYPVSTKKPSWSRLKRPDGGFDHTQCGLGMSTYEFQAVRQEGRVAVADSPSEGGRARKWVHRKHLDDGTWVITCALCGKRFRRAFRPDKHEDPKLAAADHVGTHLDSTAHAAAVAAYRDEIRNELLLASIFGEVVRTNEERRRWAGRRAAEGADG